MRYGNYNGYSEGGYGRRGRYREGGSGGGYSGGYNGGRGSGRYRGEYGHYSEEMIEELMEEMKEQYMDYSEGKESYNRGGSYNGEEQMVEATQGIMTNVVEIIKKLAETDNPQVMQIIQKSAKKIMEM